MLNKVDAKFDQMLKDSPELVKSLKITKEQFVQVIFNLSMGEVNKKLESFNLETDANNRAAKVLGGVHNMPYSFGKKTILLPK